MGWNTSVVGFTLTLQRQSFKYVCLYFLPTGKSLDFFGWFRWNNIYVDGSKISRNVCSDFFDEFPHPSHRLPCSLWLASHHTSGQNSFIIFVPIHPKCSVQYIFSKYSPAAIILIHLCIYSMYSIYVYIAYTHCAGMNKSQSQCLIFAHVILLTGIYLFVEQKCPLCQPDVLVAYFLQVLVTMFTTVLSNTPSEPTGLTALAIWILIH